MFGGPSATLMNVATRFRRASRPSTTLPEMINEADRCCFPDDPSSTKVFSQRMETCPRHAFWVALAYRRYLYCVTMMP
jgi:hypothetical protein